MIRWLVINRSTLRRTRKSRAIRPFRAASFAPTISSYPFVSLSLIFRTSFQVPYPVSPFFATLTKTAGVWGYSSHFGTARAVLPTRTPYITQVLSFQILAHSFALSCTFLHSPKTHPLSFHAIPHSFTKKSSCRISAKRFSRILSSLIHISQNRGPK